MERGPQRKNECAAHAWCLETRDIAERLEWSSKFFVKNNAIKPFP